MAEPQKATIYIDVDDEITAVIDKMRSASEKIVALVLPKRATVFQSIVNVKLLKRASEQAKKHLVLVTSEPGVLSLAGVVGVLVAKTPQSKPAIPTSDEVQDQTDSQSGDKPLDKTASIGALAGLPDNEDETIEMSTDQESGDTPAQNAKKSNKKLRIPNFEKFRVRFFLGIVGLIALIVGWVFAAVVLPSARIVIHTDTTTVSTNLTIVASPKAKEVNKTGNIVPATTKEFKKTDTVKVPTSGQKDMGTKATGTMEVTNCSPSTVTIPAGTSFSAGNFTFLSQKALDVPPSNYDFFHNCKNDGQASVDVAAQNAGDNYNLSARSYHINNGPSNVTAAGSAMTGGTSKVIKVVAQVDLDAAKQKIVDQNTQAARDDVTKQLNADNFIPLNETFAANATSVTSSPALNEEGGETTVTVTVSYTMFGVQKDGLTQLVEDQVKRNIDIKKQSILDNGLGKAVFQILNKPASGDIKLSVQTQALAGVAQDVDSIKKAVAGKKKGDTKAVLLQRPGVKDVDVSYSPFWVASTPNKLSKITIVFEQNNEQANTTP